MRGRWTAAIAAFALLAACSSGGASGTRSSTSTTTEAERAGAAYKGPGPYPAGVITLTTSAGDKVDVWYPAQPGSEAGRPRVTYSLADWLPTALRSKVPKGVADYQTDAYRDLPPATRGGPFPLVLFSHGFASYRDQSTFLTTHLATWGIVVAAPDHPSRGLTAVLTGASSDPNASLADMRGALALVKAQATRHGTVLDGLVDLTRIGLIGHSAGGGTILQVADDPQLGPQVDTYVSLASGQLGDAPLPDKPSLFMDGTDDHIVAPSVTRAAYAKAPAPKRLYEFAGAGHLAFADICEIGNGKGGVLGLAETFHITVPPSLQQLATDGCKAGQTPPPEVWPAVDDLVTAHLRAVWGIDRRPVGLDTLDAYGDLEIHAKADPPGAP